LIAGRQLGWIGWSSGYLLEIRDEDHIEENVYFIDSLDKIYVARVKVEMHYPRGRRGGIKRIFETPEIKGGY